MSHRMMSHRTFGMLIACALSGLLLASSPLPADAMQKAAKTSRKSSKENSKSVKSRPPRLPRYFSQLKLDESQRKQVLQLQTRYASKLEKIQRDLDKARKEMEDLKHQRDRDLNKLLKTQQKRKLKELKNQGKKK